MNGGRNSEGYVDPTASRAIDRVDREREQLKRVKRALRKTAKRYGFEICGMVEIRPRDGNGCYQVPF